MSWIEQGPTTIRRRGSDTSQHRLDLVPSAEDHLGHTTRHRQFLADRPRGDQRIESLDPEVAGWGSYGTVLGHRHS